MAKISEKQKFYAEAAELLRKRQSGVLLSDENERRLLTFLRRMEREKQRKNSSAMYDTMNTERKER